MTKKEKMMVTRKVMMVLGVLCMILSINENLNIESTIAENILAVVGFILCIPMYSFGICHITKV